MTDKLLPKSLHTVRILVAVASYAIRKGLIRGFSNYVDPVLYAASIIGYPDASASDPLIQKAGAFLAPRK